jgi:hypothetical protein
MAVGESAGTVYVTIDGDLSPLLAKYAQAETVTRAAGTRIGSALVSPLVDASGRAMVAVTTISGSLVGDLTPAAQRATAATNQLTQSNGQLATSFNRVASAAHGSVSEIQATSGALRVLEGNSALRAAERFLTIIPGLGAALQYAFPIVGAIALFEGLSRLVGKSEELKEAEKELADATQKTDESFYSMERTLDRLQVSRVTAAFGAAAGKGAEATQLEQQAKQIKVAMDDARDAIQNVAQAEAGSLKNYIPFHSDQASIDKIKAAGQAVKQLQNELQSVEGQSGGAREDQAREVQTQGGSLAAKRIEDEEQAASRAQEIARQRRDGEIEGAHAAEQARIALIDSGLERTRQAGEEEIRYAKAKEDEIASYAITTRDRTIGTINDKLRAESAGKSRPEREQLSETAQAGTEKAGQDYTLATDKARLDTQKATESATQNDVRAQREAADQITRVWEQAAEAKRKKAEEYGAYVAKQFEDEIYASIKVKEIQDKGAGDLKALQIQAQKIQLERQYGIEASHSAAEQVSHARQLAQYDSQEREQRLEGLQTQLKDAQVLDEKSRDKVREATLEQEIAKLKQENANADAQAAAAVDDLNRKLTQQLTLQQQIANAKNAASGTLQTQQRAIGTNIGNEIGALPKQVGDDIGTSISSALLGHHPGKSIGQEMAKALEQSLKQTASQLLGKAISSAIQLGIGALKSAIQGTTQAATQSAANAAAITAPIIASQGADTATLVAGQITQTSAIGGFIAAATSAIVTAIGVAAGIDVFADGTSSAPGGMALIGEKGPEIMHVPRGAQIIPNHAIHKYAEGTPGWHSSSHYQSTSFQTGTTNLHFHAHGISDPDRFTDHVMRKIPEALKRTSPGYSPFSK